MDFKELVHCLVKVHEQEVGRLRYELTVLRGEEADTDAQELAEHTEGHASAVSPGVAPRPWSNLAEGPLGPRRSVRQPHTGDASPSDTSSPKARAVTVSCAPEEGQIESVNARKSNHSGPSSSEDAVNGNGDYDDDGDDFTGHVMTMPSGRTAFRHKRPSGDLGDEPVEAQPSLEPIIARLSRKSSNLMQEKETTTAKDMKEINEVIQDLVSMEDDAALNVSGFVDNPRRRKRRIANLHIDKSPKTGWEAFLTGPFENVMSLLIVLNAAVMFTQLYFAGVQIGVGLDLESEDDTWKGSDEFFDTLEHIFNAIFLVELTAKIAILRGQFIWDVEERTLEKFNIFDIVVVVFCTMDLWVLPIIFGKSSGNIGFFRLIRLARLSRGLKVIRVMKVFSKLRILVRTVASSFMALMWSMVLLGVLNFGGAVFLCQLLQGAITEDTSLSPETQEWLYRYYGTSAKSVWTMFEFTFSGGWPNYARPVVEQVHWSYAFFFAFYVSVVVFAVTRIITALFLKDTLQIAANDADMMVQEQMASKQRYTEKLRDLFELADASGNGSITLEEFEAVCRIPEVHTYFHLLELEIGEVQALFNMLDDGDGAVSYDEFMRGIIRLKGQARSMDVITVMRDCREINDRCRRLEEDMRHIETMATSSVSFRGSSGVLSTQM